MEGYNDYCHITKNYLRNYNGFKLALDNLKQERIRLETEYINIKTPIAKYGLEPGGENELTSTERTAEIRIKMREQIKNIGVEINGLELKVRQIDFSLDSLTELEKKIIDLRFNKHMSWIEVANDIGYSERGCRKRANSIIYNITNKMFGHKMFVERKFTFVS